MNLFGKIFFRKLKSTEVYEKENDALLHSFNRYQAIVDSELLQEYLALRKEVKSAEFKENKKILINRKFKDTEEYRNWRTFQKLEKKSQLHRYFAIAGSKELAEFLRFKETPQYELIGNKIELKKSEELQRFRAYEKSDDYKIYTRFHGSYVVEEYDRLKAIVQRDEFVAFKEFWSNPNRWVTTEAFQKEQQFKQLSQHADITFYQRTDPASFFFYQNWHLVFNDEFNGVALDKQKWGDGYYFSDPALIRDYSLIHHKQANNRGKNVSVADGCMVIETIEEQSQSRAWDAQRGFVMHQFSYTSDVINAGAAFQFCHGVVEAKMRVHGDAITHVFGLVCENRLPQIDVFHVDGRRIKVGNAWQTERNIELIKGISPSKFYIYKLEWTADELIWSINNVEVYRTSQGVPSMPLFPIFASIVDEKQKGVGVFEVDWLRIYQKKQ